MTVQIDRRQSLVSEPLETRGNDWLSLALRKLSSRLENMSRMLGKFIGEELGKEKILSTDPILAVDSSSSSLSQDYLYDSFSSSLKDWPSTNRPVNLNNDS